MLSNAIANPECVASGAMLVTLAQGGRRDGCSQRPPFSRPEPSVGVSAQCLISFSPTMGAAQS